MRTVDRSGPQRTEGEQGGMVVLMVLAVAYGLVQLGVLSLATRTVRMTTLLLLAIAGGYACGSLALLVEIAYTRLASAISHRPLYALVEQAGYTVDPVIEELVKIAPLLALIVLARRIRYQWGHTDYLLTGAAIGTGFALAEALMRFSGKAFRAIGDGHGGFLLATSLQPPHILGPLAVLGRWLPPPVDSFDLFGLGAGAAGVNFHLVWTGLAGLGLGAVVRTRSAWRLLGLLPLAYAALDHAANNYAIAKPGTEGVGGLALHALDGLRTALPGVVLLALIAATVLDLRTSRTIAPGHPALQLAGERAGTSSLVVLRRLARMAPPWTVLIAGRFVLARRAARYELAATGGQRTALYEAVAEVATQLDRAGDPGRWRQATTDLRRDRPGSWARLRRPVTLLWIVLLMPAVLYLVLGAVPLTSGLQQLLATEWVFPVLGVLVVAAVGYLGWQLVRSGVQLRRDRRQPFGELVIRSAARVATAAGCLTLGLALLGRWLTGGAGSDVMLSTFHILDALSNLLLAAAVALFLAGLILYPPFALVALTTGGIALETTSVVGATLATTAGAVVLGELSVVLSQAADSTGASSSSGGSGGSGSSFPELSTSRAQIEAKFKHAADFGVREPRTAKGFEAFGRALRDFLKNPSTVRTSGTYRGKPAILNYDPTSRLVVVQSTKGEFISGWRMTLAQLQNVLTRGSLGGG